MNELHETSDIEQKILWLLPGNISSDLKILWTALFAFTMEIMQSLAAMNVFVETKCSGVFIPSEQKRLWDLIIDSVWRRLVSDITKIFDKDKIYNKQNCSVMHLKRTCLQEEQIFQNNIDPLICKLNELQQEYERVITTTTRNKTVAHHDYDTFRNGIENYIDLVDINDLVENLSIAIIQLGKRLFDLDFQFPPINTLQQQYKKAIISMITMQKSE